jgi:hypothetical protein
MAKNYAKLYAALLKDHEAQGLELERAKLDRDAWRVYVLEKFRWLMGVHRDNKAPILPWLIDNMGSFILSRFQY